MRFLELFFKKDKAQSADDYQKIYLRWEKHGKEYGPMSIEEIPKRQQHWSGPPIQARFENENKWRKFKFFFDISINLLATKKQKDILTKYQIQFDDENLKYIEAEKIIDTIISEIKENEKRKKENLPATKKTIEKLDALGIKHSDNITRKEAKFLLKEHEDIEDTKKLLESMLNYGLDITSVFNLAEITSNSIEEKHFLGRLNSLKYLLDDLKDYSFKINFPTSMNTGELSDLVDSLEDLEFYGNNLNEYGIKISIPPIIDMATLKKLSENIENAFDDVEEADSQITEKEIYACNGDYKLTGNIRKNELNKLLEDVFEKSLNCKWNHEKNILKLIDTYMPDIKIKEIDD